MREDEIQVGQILTTVEGYKVKVVAITEISDGGIWALIPSVQPRIMVEALEDYPPHIKRGDIGGYNPVHLQPLTPTLRQPEFSIHEDVVVCARCHTRPRTEHDIYCAICQHEYRHQRMVDNIRDYVNGEGQFFSARNQTAVLSQLVELKQELERLYAACRELKAGKETNRD